MFLTYVSLIAEDIAVSALCFLPVKGSTSYFRNKAPQGGLQDMPVSSCDGPTIINLSAYG